ncbi:MAG: ABC transporter permease [Planctomycetota bacterium]
MSKVFAIARVVRQEAMREGVFYAVLVVFTFLTAASPFYAFFAFHDTVKLVRDMGLASVTMAGLIIMLFTASGGIAEDLERRTALLLLAKPVSRPAFVWGRYLGILQAVVVPMVWLTAVLILVLLFGRFEGVRDSWRELAEGEILKGGLLAFVEVAVLAAAAVLFSTFASSAVTFLLTTAVFAFGHLSAYATRHLAGREGIPAGLGRLVFAVLPDLEHFSAAPRVGAGMPVPGEEVALAALYGALFAGGLLILAGLLFERREIG